MQSRPSQAAIVPSNDLHCMSMTKINQFNREKQYVRAEKQQAENLLSLY